MFEHFASSIGGIAAVIAMILGIGAAPHGEQPEGHPGRVKVTEVSAGTSVFESGEHRCQTAESAAWGYRQEPALAVNPADPQNLVAIWRQDQWGGAFFEGEGGAALSDVVAYSTNGGSTWTEVVVPALGVCGPEGNGASDPTVSFGPDGTAYIGALQFGMSADNIAVVSYRSDDGGRTWDGPHTVQGPDSFNDKATIVADPVKPGQVYAIWTRFQPLNSVCLCAHLAIARSTDGGRTWLGPRVVDRPGDRFTNGAAQLDVLPDGTLVALYSRLTVANTIHLSGDHEASIYAARSTDGGRTWSRHHVVDYTSGEPGGHDPDSDHTIMAGEFFIEQAAGPDGELYAVWHHTSSISQGEVFLARSTDGGVTWTDPVTVAEVPAQVLDPVAAVADDGTVAVMWADLRNDDDVPGQSDDNELTADWWLATSSDGGATWRQTHLSGPFDLRNALFTRGNQRRDRAPTYWIGEYSGLVAMPGGFGGVFIQAREPRQEPGWEASISQTDVLFARVRLKGTDR